MKDDKEEDDEAPAEVKDKAVGNGAAPEPNAQDSRETRSKAKAAAAQSSVDSQELTAAASIERDTAIDLVRKTESKKVAAEIMSRLKSWSYHDLRAKALALGLIKDSRRVITSSLALSCDSISRYSRMAMNSAPPLSCGRCSCPHSMSRRQLKWASRRFASFTAASRSCLAVRWCAIQSRSHCEVRWRPNSIRKIVHRSPLQRLRI
jgi:hypothetical protein